MAPATVVINLPRHAGRRDAITQHLKAVGLPFDWAPAVDGAALDSSQLASLVTPLGRWLLTDGMRGCFLSHIACWEMAARKRTPLLVLEDDAVLVDAFQSKLAAALSELVSLDESWDVMLVGGLGCVHPRGRYGLNVIVGLMGGGMRWPTRLSDHISVPLRPFGTHAYLVSPAGARKLLALCPRANFHVDVAAWGQTSVRLYLALDGEGQMLAKQSHAGDSTIGGLPRSRWLPALSVDAYTGADFFWAFNAPVLSIGGFLTLTIGRSICSTALLFALAYVSGGAAVRFVAFGWLAVQFCAIQALKVPRWPSVRRSTVSAIIVLALALAARFIFASPAADSAGGGSPPTTARLQLGPVAMGHGGRLELERAPGRMEAGYGTLARLRVVGGRVFDEAALANSFGFFDDVLAMRRPFTVLWDPRRVVWPRVSARQMQMVRAWVEVQVIPWDTHVQAHVLLLTNPIVRSLAALAVRLFAPPQPVRVVSSESEADAFHKSIVGSKSWVKASYADRDQRYGAFSLLPSSPIRLASSASGAACAFVPPSASGWGAALATHLSLSGLIGAPTALLLYLTPRRARRTVGLLLGVALCAAVPLGAWLLRRRHGDGYLPWMSAFLASTFGFATLFKALTVALDACPAGADADLPTWMLWFTSLPEPTFANGKPVPRAAGELSHRAKLLCTKLLLLGVVISVLDSAPVASPSRGAVLPWLLVAELQLWAIYLWAAGCLDVGALLVHAAGFSVEPPFDNPLLASRSLREAWGDRWNRPVHLFLKRTVYVPVRRAGVPARLAAFCTFLASGLLHEYNFFTHNAKGYAPGEATLFFTLMGFLMLAEAAASERLRERTPPRVRAALAATPSVAIAVALQLVVLPLFSRLFVRSWVQSGMLQAVGELLPTLRCEYR